MRMIPLNVAVILIVAHSRKERTTIAANKRVIRAMLSLGLRGQELLHVGAYLEVWTSVGNPYLPGSPSFEDQPK